MRTDNLVIGIGGWDNSGKDTVAQLLAVELEKQTGKKVEIIGMSDTLKTIIYAMNPLIRNDDEIQYFREIMREYELVGIPERKAYEYAKEIPDVRNFLRTMGNRVGRELISHTLWPDIVKARIGRDFADVHVIVTGIRHQTDLDMIQEFAAGMSVYVTRPGCEPTDQEPGEGQLQPTQFKFGVFNGGTVEDLSTKNIPALVQVMQLEWNRVKEDNGQGS